MKKNDKLMNNNYGVQASTEAEAENGGGVGHFRGRGPVPPHPPRLGVHVYNAQY